MADRATMSSIGAGLHTERVVALRGFPGWAELSPGDLSVVAEHARDRFFPAGAVMVPESEPVRSVFLIVRGDVRVACAGHTARDVRSRTLVGHIPVLSRSSRRIVATAVTDVVALEVAADVLRDLLADNFVLLWSTLSELARMVISIHLELGEGAGFAGAKRREGLTPPPTLLDKLSLLLKSETFAGARVESLADLAREATVVHLSDDTELWQAGDPATTMLLPLQGEVHATSMRGQQFTFGAGDSVGGLDVLAEQPRWYTARAAGSLTALEIDADALYDVMELHPDLALANLRGIATHVDDLFLRVVEKGLVAAF